MIFSASTAPTISYHLVPCIYQPPIYPAISALITNVVTIMYEGKQNNLMCTMLYSDKENLWLLQVLRECSEVWSEFWFYMLPSRHTKSVPEPMNVCTCIMIPNYIVYTFL